MRRTAPRSGLQTNWSGLRESNDNGTDAKSDRMASALGTNTTVLAVGGIAIAGIAWYGLSGSGGGKKELPERA